ncbi:glycosyltransferase family 2 protein [Lichenifustis flavocetrariae]|uniref:Glycosyltransferase family 2 protein n=1 Tax=Lichenifustis flavocetrariae TaxID=2949735 RepID=A0AA41YT63_9HYPH|nr:glycosyltransferase family 2 protein [Lichenifustis flavocetrariae]MCW6506562.1 glycosyltransferase family 2 protein [Lichenifustis flavocetrariae]
MTEVPTLAILLTCFNRRAKTLACLASIEAQDAQVSCRIVLFDDGSTDGTATSVRRHYPEVEILEGKGDAFWSGGMRAAFTAAMRHGADFYLWLNDDVRLAPDALRTLLTTHADLVRQGRPLCLIGGGVADPRDGGTSYAGIIRPWPDQPLRFDRKAPDAAAPVPCDTLVGNVVLVPRLTAETIGGIGRVFRHTLGDLDYGLRVAAAGGWVGLAPGHVGWCERNGRSGHWFNQDLGLVARWRLLPHPLGFPLRPWFHFARRHGGSLWFVFAVLPFWRLVVPVRLARHVDRWRRPLQSREARHA